MYLHLQHLVDSFQIRGEKTYSRMFNGERFVSISYRQLYDAVLKIAQFLQKKKNIKQKDKIVIISENRPEWIMSYLGVVYNGLIAVPLDALLTPDEILNLISDSEASTVFTSAAIFTKLKDNPKIMNQVKEWIIFDKDSSLSKCKGKINFLQDIIETPLAAMQKQEIQPIDIASLIYTSGTTGHAKAVILTHKNFIHQVNNLRISAELTENDIEFSILPLHHTLEFSVEMTVLGTGASITYAESIKPNRLIAAIKETQVTIMVGIPALYKKILDGIMKNINELKFPLNFAINILYKTSEFFYGMTGSHKVGEKFFRFLRKKAGFDTVRFMISGAAPLSEQTSKGFAILGFNLGNGYGLTEASPVVSVNPPSGPIFNQSVGIAVPHVSWKIIDANNEGIGEICVKGDNVMQGYYNNPEATRAAFTEDNWLKTGDMGFIKTHAHKEYLYIAGRYKNIIVTSGGKNVYPEEIEELINTHPYILESLVLGVPQSANDPSESVCALIVLDSAYLESNQISNPKEIQTHMDQHIREINKKLHMYQMIRGYEIRTEELIKNSTRKVKRFEYKGKDFQHLLH